MIRSIDEMMLADKNLSEHNISDTLAFAITSGDYLRARRRRYPLSLVLMNPTMAADGFEGEATQCTTTQRNFRYSMPYSSMYNVYIFNSYKEYIDD